MPDSLDRVLGVLACLDWVSPLLHLVNTSTGQVSIEATPGALVALERAGVSCEAPMYYFETGTYLFTVKRSDLPKARRVLARLGVYL